MNDIPVYISAEDAVTKEIIRRVLAYCSSRFKVMKEIPARGGEIKSKMGALNALSQTNPVILLTDLDANDCAPLLKKELLNGMTQMPNFLINIAVDEGEAWLMADRKGFAKFLKVEENVIPESSLQKMGGMKKVREMDFNCKSSWMLTKKIIHSSRSEELRNQIIPQGNAVKGREYNSAILPFIQKEWDIDSAQQNSDSLSRMIKRLKDLAARL